MFQQKQSQLLTLLLILMLLNTYIIKVEIIDALLVIIVIGSIVYFNRQTLKELSIWQNIGILLLFIGIITLLVGFFYFVASPVVQMISIGWIRYIVQIVMVIGTLIPTIVLLYKGMSKITNGKFPNTNIEVDQEPKEYPVNEEIKQLIQNGETIKAVKVARELYDYSLVEAKRYVDEFK